MVDAAVALAVAKGDAAMYEKMLRVAQTATDPDLKQDALHALTRFQAPELVERTLEYAVSDEVRSQDSWTLIARLLERRETQDLAWAFVQQHWAEIARRQTESSGARIVEAAGAFCTVERRDEVAELFCGASGGVDPADAGEVDRQHQRLHPPAGGAGAGAAAVAGRARGAVGRV